MSKALFTEARFTNDEAARDYLETVRWPHGPVCPHCGGTERNSKITSSDDAKAKARPGLMFCGDCRSQFTVTVGTVFERSKIPLHKWVLATHLLCASKKGMSSHQLHRMLGITYKTAWFMAHRIREAMGDEPAANEGGAGGGGKAAALVKRSATGKGKRISTRSIKAALVDQQAAHHGVPADSGSFNLLKRGLIGTYHHVGAEHLGRYVDEFDFRYALRDISDGERAMAVLAGISGKRLTYRPTV